MIDRSTSIIYLIPCNLQGYNDQDYNQVNDALNSTAIKELDLDFAKLAQKVPRPKQRTGDDDDDMGGGLCQSKL